MVHFLRNGQALGISFLKVQLTCDNAVINFPDFNLYHFLDLIRKLLSVILEIIVSTWFNF